MELSDWEGYVPDHYSAGSGCQATSILVLNHLLKYKKNTYFVVNFKGEK